MSAQKSFVRWGTVLLALLIILFVGLILFSPAMHIREITVVRLDPRLDIEEVQSVLIPFFDQHLFFLPASEVISLVEESVPDAQEVRIEKRYPSELAVHVGLHPLIARIKIRDPDVSEEDVLTHTGAYFDFLTEQGIYVSTVALQNAQALPMITFVDWGVRPLQGTKLIDPSFLQKMDAAEISLTQQFGKPVKSRTIFMRAQEFHIELEDYTLWFDVRTTIEDQLQRYRTFLQSVDLSTISEYIDLRLTDRVIYK